MGEQERRTERLGVAFYPSEVERYRQAAAKDPRMFSDVIREALNEWARKRLKSSASKP